MSKRLDAARAERQLLLSEMQRIVELCECEWPIVKWRNGSGHEESCPAHRWVRQLRVARR